MAGPKGRRGRNEPTARSHATVATVQCVALNFLAVGTAPLCSVSSGKDTVPKCRTRTYLELERKWWGKQGGGEEGWTPR